MWEEPCISGKEGSGAVFFSGCTLKCCFFQNFEISQQYKGYEVTERELADIFLKLQDKGANNINLVSPTPFVPGIISALVSPAQSSESLLYTTAVDMKILKQSIC